MADEPHIRPYRQQDEPELAALFKTCFGVDIAPAYFDWKYHQNPAGEVIGSVAEAGERLVAFLGAIPEPWTVGGADATIYQGTDMMTHPDFRSRGLWARLAQATYDDLRRRSGRCDLVAVSGNTALPGAKKRSWSVAHEFAPIVLPAVAARVRRRYRAGGLAVEPIVRPDARVQYVLSQTSETPGAARPRLEGEFFDWRVFGRSPKRFRVALVSKHAEPVAIAVYARTSPRTTLLSYLATVPDAGGDDWFGALARFAARDGVVLYSWQPQQPWLAALYREAGFRPNPLGRGPLTEPWTLIVYSDTGLVNDVRWDASTSFDVQPLMQD